LKFYFEKMRQKKRKKIQPQWKLALLWTYLTMYIILTIYMTYMYQFSPELKIELNNTRTNYTCFVYRGNNYCCENNYWLLITDIDVNDNITDDNISVTDCFKLEKV